MNRAMKVARAQQGFTQIALAKKLKLSQQKLSLIETGWVPPLKIQLRLADVLRTPVETLFAREVA